MKKSILLIALFALIGCDNQINDVATSVNTEKITLSTNEYISISSDDNSEISDDKIVDIISSFMDCNIPKSRSVNMHIRKRGFLQNQQNVKGYLFNNFVQKIPVCEVTIENQSNKNTALICTDSRFPFIYAFYEDDKEEKETTPAYDLLIKSSEEIVMSQINQIEQLKDSLKAPTLKKIAAKLSIDTNEISFNKIRDRLIISNNLTRSKIVDEGTIDKDSGLAKYGPYISVRWDCGMPYNRNLPQSCPENWLWDERYVVNSCVVSIAQILSFYKPSVNAQGISIDWDYLCKNQEIYEESDYFGSYVQDPIKKREMIGSLMKYIGDQCEVMYNCSGSSIYLSKIESFFNRYGIKVSRTQTMNLNILKDGLDNIHPVLVSGATNSNQSHWWVVDGYSTKVATRGDTFFPGFYVYFHANMGQGKSYTGYYLAGSDGTLTFDASFAHFTKNFNLYTLSK